MCNVVALIVSALLSVPANTPHEHGGVIIQRKDGSCYATEPASQGDYGEFSAVIRLPRSARIVAIYHNHPGALLGSTTKFASPADIAMANALGVPTYIRVDAENKLRVYDPKRHSRQEQKIVWSF